MTRFHPHATTKMMQHTIQTCGASQLKAYRFLTLFQIRKLITTNQPHMPPTIPWSPNLNKSKTLTIAWELKIQRGITTPQFQTVARLLTVASINRVSRSSETSQVKSCQRTLPHLERSSEFQRMADQSTHLSTVTNNSTIHVTWMFAMDSK